MLRRSAEILKLRAGRDLCGKTHTRFSRGLAVSLSWGQVGSRGVLRALLCDDRSPALLTREIWVIRRISALVRRWWGQRRVGPTEYFCSLVDALDPEVLLA